MSNATFILSGTVGEATAFVGGVIDPLDAYQDAEQGRVYKATGIIPNFAVYAQAKHGDTARKVFDLMGEAYGFGSFESEGATVSPEGVYSYPGDTDLMPLVQLSLADGAVQVLIYPHAIVAVRDADETLVTIMN